MFIVGITFWIISFQCKMGVPIHHWIPEGKIIIIHS